MAEYQGSFDDAQVTLIEPGDPIPADFRAKLEAAQDEALTAVVELLTHYGEGDAHATGSRALRDWTRPQLVNAAMWALISLARERHPELKP